MKRKRKAEDDSEEKLFKKLKDKLSSWATEPVQKEESVLDHLKVPNSYRRRNTLSHWTIRLASVMSECLANLNWEGAAAILRAMTYEKDRTSEILWTAGIKIFCNHPNSNSLLLGQFSHAMYRLNKINEKAITLENVIYFLDNHNFEGAQQAIKSAVSKRITNPKLTEKDKRIIFILEGYKGLLLYVEWILQQNKTIGSMNEENEVINSQFSITDTTMQPDDVTELSELIARRAIETFEELFTNPGNWDIFISKYIELMEFYGRQDEAIKTLENYCKLNLTHANGHKYWYDLVKRHQPHEISKLREILKVLVYINPSDPRILEFDSESRHKRGCLLLETYFNAVDYPVWKSDWRLWQAIVDLIKFIRKKILVKEYAKLELIWKDRKDWWPSYHFRNHDIKIKSEADALLLINKAAAVSLLIKLDHEYIKKVKRALKKSRFKHLLRKFQSMLQETSSVEQASSDEDFEKLLQGNGDPLFSSSDDECEETQQLIEDCLESLKSPTKKKNRDKKKKKKKRRIKN